MAFGFDVVPDVLDLSVRADQERAAHDAQKRLAQEFLHAACTVGFDHLEVGIAEQRKIELLLLREGRLSFHGLAAGAQNGYAQFVELLLCVTKLGRFCRSTGSIGFGEKEQDDALAAVVAQRNVIAVIRLQGEIRSLIAWLEHESPPYREQCRYDCA